MVHASAIACSVRCDRALAHPSPLKTERDAMHVLKSQTFRVVMILSALASSSLVLMAGRRWF
jgi:hypothetical protein